MHVEVFYRRDDFGAGFSRPCVRGSDFAKRRGMGGELLDRACRGKTAGARDLEEPFESIRPPGAGKKRKTLDFSFHGRSILNANSQRARLMDHVLVRQSLSRFCSKPRRISQFVGEKLRTDRTLYSQLGRRSLPPCYCRWWISRGMPYLNDWNFRAGRFGPQVLAETKTGHAYTTN